MIVVVMGVSGSGKSTIAQSLAKSLGWDFQEGDDLHPQSNIDKMSAGIALDDNDRSPWLDSIAAWTADESQHGHNAVVTCSALKRSYRDRLRSAGASLRFVYIRVARNELERRTQHRLHFMPASLLDSQLETLEEPAPDENALVLLGDEATIDRILEDIRAWLDLPNAKQGA
jgi:gluconokinase